MIKLTSIASVLLVTFAAVCSSACSNDRPEPTKVADTTPAPLRITPERTDLVFRYRAADGTVASASALDDIPAAARKSVVVWDDKAPTPAGWDLVADLSNGLPTDAKPLRDFDFPPPAAAPRADHVATNDGNHEVYMFSTEGCGYCAKARKFFKSNSIPYTELDIEADPKNASTLASMGKKAGLGPNDMQGVPIMFVDGQPVLGWDQGRLSHLLGLGG